MWGKMTLTQYYPSVDLYSLPKPQNILATLAGEGGEGINNLKFVPSLSYTQADEESQKLVIINTNQGKGCINLRDHLLE